jgi:hypothetical protein
MRTIAAFAIALAMLSAVIVRASSPRDQATEGSAPKYYLVTYNVSDLPVWRNKGKVSPEFAPELLTNYLRATIDPHSWSAGAEIRPVRQRASLVISQTGANHKKIREAINSFREANPGEVREVAATSPPLNVGDFVPIEQNFNH